VLVAVVIQHENRIFSAPYCMVTCGLSGSETFFLHYLINGTIFGGGGESMDRETCVLIFSETLV